MTKWGKADARGFSMHCLFHDFFEFVKQFFRKN